MGRAFGQNEALQGMDEDSQMNLHRFDEAMEAMSAKFKSQAQKSRRSIHPPRSASELLSLIREPRALHPP